jgi:uncharacterized repeat protein (TIGR03803 family)
MHNKGRFPSVMFSVSLRPQSAALAIMVLLLFLIFLFLFLTLTAQPVQGQTTVIHSFYGPDGANPDTGLITDGAGNLYGTTSIGGHTGGDCGTVGWPYFAGCGEVFKLSKYGSTWILIPIHQFQGGSDGKEPEGRVIFGPDGSLYGTTAGGGWGFGTVFNLRPSAHASPNALGGWTETVLYRFAGGADGASPEGDLTFDQAGNIYGTTQGGGPASAGTVYKLTRSSGGWTESVLYSFTGGRDGYHPLGGVILDQYGSLYGTTMEGGDFTCDQRATCGTLFALAPSGNGWQEYVLYSFQGGNDGYYPRAGLTLDQSGTVLYGTASTGGALDGGTVFAFNGVFSLIYSLQGVGPFPPVGPVSNLTLDVAGNLYGTTREDGNGTGSVFKLTPSDGGWQFTSYDFEGGYLIQSNVILGPEGKLYGTANGGVCYPPSSCGTVWEITP